MLPPYAFWTREEWKYYGKVADGIRTQRLGWDITDFDSGNFDSIGLTLFTLRNGSTTNNSRKPYAEKIMHVRKDQVTPYHYHGKKSEDIINRGGKNTGRLLVELYNTNENGGFVQTPVSVNCDGLIRHVSPGGSIILGPGESITLHPFLYHTFRAMDGDALVGEVSSFNDDETDNYFSEPVGRFPKIIEDEAAIHMLCNEYRALGV